MLSVILCIIIELLATAILLSKVFIYNNYNSLITLVVVVVTFILSRLLRGRSVKSRDRDVFFCIGIGCTLVQLLLYVLSIKTGFIKNELFIFGNHFDNFIEMLIIMLLTESIRAQVMKIDIRSKFKSWVVFILLVLLTTAIDINVSSKILTTLRYTTIFKYVSIVVVSSLSKNTLLCYLSKHYGIKSTIIYRLIMDLSIYIIPISDTVNEFIRCVMMFIFPFIIYVIIDEFTDRVKEEDNKKKKKLFKQIIEGLIGIVIAIVVILVSRETVYCMIGVGSGSMTGTINKGDALVYQKYDKDFTKYESKRLKEGDIIVFKRSGVLILHRINTVISSNGIDKYITKGDYNENVDNWIVTQDDIEGVALFRVPYIAWPSVYLSELFK